MVALVGHVVPTRPAGEVGAARRPVTPAWRPCVIEVHGHSDQVVDPAYAMGGAALVKDFARRSKGTAIDNAATAAETHVRDGVGVDIRPTPGLVDADAATDFFPVPRALCVPPMLQRASVGGGVNIGIVSIRCIRRRRTRDRLSDSDLLALPAVRIPPMPETPIRPAA